MVKKQYEKPEIKDFISPALHGQISPMGVCNTGLGAGGAGNCSTGDGVVDLPDCTSGTRPAADCVTGTQVGTCYTGTYA